MRQVILLALLVASSPVRADEKEKRSGESHDGRERAAAPQPEPLPSEISGEQKPPPGSAEDQALWSDAAELTRRVHVSRAEATRLQWDARTDRFDERLGERARQASGGEAEKLLGLQKLYREALATNYLTLTRRWPVDPTRGCGYAMLHLGSAMREGKAELLGPSRADVRACVARARPAVEVMEASNADVARVSAEAARLLGPAPAAPAAPGKGT
ncbi:MAG: hypothetical protein HZB56_13050 [Deltaproteobacteria bacterium]|nr:hypothetical protein [Deltaproteobacteria bacterium]